MPVPAVSTTRIQHGDQVVLPRPDTDQLTGSTAEALFGDPAPRLEEVADYNAFASDHVFFGWSRDPEWRGSQVSCLRGCVNPLGGSIVGFVTKTGETS